MIQEIRGSNYCAIPPRGWYCSRAVGHSGPCAAYPVKNSAYRWRWGILFKLESLWVGFYWSKKNQRLCVNLVPCVTLWITRPGGEIPHGADFDDKWQLTN